MRTRNTVSLSDLTRAIMLLLLVTAFLCGAGAAADAQAGGEKEVVKQPAPAASPPSDPVALRLDEAWRYYGFGEYKSADRLFLAVSRESSAGADQKLQARIGHAFVVQYRQPGRDPAAALELYRGILADLPRGHAYRALVLSRMGACCIEGKRPDATAGRKYLEQAIEAAGKGSLVRQECVLQLALSHLHGDPGRPQLESALAELRKRMPLLRGGVLEGAAHNLAAGLALLLDDPRLMERELEAWVKAGIRNFTFRASVYFKIARINELVLRNFDKARRYYEKLAREEPSDARSYFSRVRAGEIAAGRIRDGDLALPREAFRGRKGAPARRPAAGERRKERGR